MSDAVTNGIRVQVRPAYLEERSSPAQEVYFFVYEVTITNTGDEPAQLVSRHWVITDGMGRIQHVRGSGVVGEQPRLEPSQSFRYTSFCPLPTPVGSMQGTFQMVSESGLRFDAEIAPFVLTAPNSLN